MEYLIEQLKQQKNRNSTKATYHKVWTKFNEFIIRLDRIPRTWESRTALYCAFLVVEKGLKSTTVKSYISAIKSVLIADNYEWDNGSLLLNTITKSCKIKNDTIKTRLPIRISLLEIMLCDMQRRFGEKQPYLEALYITAFLIGYYGLFRVGELTMGDHVIRAANVHEGKNKDKILIVLYSSKTHGKESYPQKVKIIGKETIEVTSHTNKTYRKSVIKTTQSARFCPVEWLLYYIQLRGESNSPHEPLFIFHDKTPLLARQMRTILRSTLKNLNLEAELYDTHSLRIGRATDLYKQGTSVEGIKELGRWKSNAVYKYLRT